MGDIALTTVYAFFERLLRPVARVLLRHGLSLRELTELCKRVYVAAASNDLSPDGKVLNISRVALLTGMTRRDVRKVRLSLNADEEQILGRMNSATRLLSGWFRDADFVDELGAPVPLRVSGEFPSFTDLSKRYAGDIPVTAVLKELRQAAAVSENEDGLLVARTRYYMPGHDIPERTEAMFRGGSVLEDIGSTIEYNLHRGADEATRFERRASNGRIDVDAIPAFNQFIEEEGQRFLEQVDDWLSKNEVAEPDLGKTKTVRLGLGAYWIEGPDTEGAEK